MLSPEKQMGQLYKDIYTNRQQVKRIQPFVYSVSV
jgi:hypothetical protein